MNDLHDNLEPITPSIAFKHCQPEAFRLFFRQYSYRIYVYLLRQIRDRRHARELTKHCFLVLFHNYCHVSDEAHLLPTLYTLARQSLQLPEPNTVEALEAAWKTAGEDDAIMDDPTVTSNETLLTVQQAFQQLPPAKRELAERYFFQGTTILELSHILGVEEIAVRENISQLLDRLGEYLVTKGKTSFLPSLGIALSVLKFLSPS